MYVEASQPFEATFGSGVSGLVGTVEVSVEDNDGNVVIGPTSADITEIVIAAVATGVYTWQCAAAPAVLGQYTILWSPDGLWDPETTSAPEDLVVVNQSAGPLPPIPPPSGGGLATGPCTAWVTGDEVAACCSVETSSGALFDDAADIASQLLFELSGRQFSGLCSVENYRPPCDSCWCGFQVLSRGYVVMPYMWGWDLMGLCDYCLTGCSPSRVKLPGYPIREITQVTIDGDVVASSDYTLHNYRFLTRLDNHRWPRQQNLTLEPTEDHTFAVSYTYGAPPPLMGAMAAAELGCDIYKMCGGNECALPTGTTRVVRQGITIDKLSFTSWAFRERRWQTGLPAVDAFLNAYNPAGIKRRPVFWSPGKRQYAAPFG